jgi:hypothetical protein
VSVTSLVILESMWGWRAPGTVGRRAPQWFPINHLNHSGARLHRLLGVNPSDGNVWVTNACQTVQAHAKKHGTPDPAALRRNIIEFPSEIDWLIVGGKVAETTLGLAGQIDKAGDGAMREKLRAARAFFMPHPAARWWSKDMETAIAAFLAAPPEGLVLVGQTYQPGGDSVHLYTKTAERAWRYKWNGKERKS